MPRVEATIELLATRAEVWRFLEEPRHLADWWPGIGAVEPDRRGLAAGARWQLRGTSRPTLLHRPYASGLLLVREVYPLERIAWYLTRERLEVELTLSASTPTTTTGRLVVEGPWFVGLRRSLPRIALSRLHALCQTAAAV